MAIAIPGAGKTNFCWSKGHGNWLDVNVKRLCNTWICRWQIVHYGTELDSGIEYLNFTDYSPRGAAHETRKRVSF